jgi:hypothetical protein
MAYEVVSQQPSDLAGDNGGGLLFHACGDSRRRSARSGVRVFSLREGDTNARHTLKSLQQAKG